MHRGKVAAKTGAERRCDDGAERHASPRGHVPAHGGRVESSRFRRDAGNESEVACALEFERDRVAAPVEAVAGSDGRRVDRRRRIPRVQAAPWRVWRRERAVRAHRLRLTKYDSLLIPKDVRTSSRGRGRFHWSRTSSYIGREWRKRKTTSHALASKSFLSRP